MESIDDTCREHDLSSTETTNLNPTTKTLITTVAMTVLTSGQAAMITSVPWKGTLPSPTVFR